MIKGEFNVARGESFISKIKAKENCILNALRILVPGVCRNMLTDSEIDRSVPKKEQEEVKEYLSKKRKNEISIMEEEEGYDFGGCLIEDVYSELQVDDPLVVNKYLHCSNYTPKTVKYF